MKKINATPSVTEQIINTVSNNAVKCKTKGKVNQSANASVTRRDSKDLFIAFIRNKEEIGLNKFFKLFEAFKNDDPNGFKDYLFARKMDINVDYTYKWFAANCPSIADVDGKKSFAKWVKVTDKHPKSDNPEYNRVSATGVQYTLQPYNCFRASYEQYEVMLNHVVSNIKRVQKEQAAVRKAKENEARKEDLIKRKKERIARAQAQLLKLENA